MKHPTKLSETLLPAILLIVAGLVFISVWRLPVTATADLVGPKVYPGALAVLLAVFSGLLLIGAAPSHGEDADIRLPGMVRRFLPLVLFSAAYVIALPFVGFLIATTALLMACFFLLGERRLWLNFLVAAGCTLATYLLFATLLGIQLTAFPG
ncbi:MAG: tripartite tricarboxylate transporter TctB family protein [Proteobacteria bacterium]|nr:tripartite tricarboxylate transporter TctB family protein [Pseudomonadota bacterium]MBU2227586.1 tripartite tricarboxylate transporter TctB family protein [Pseudomonadota bacterium]MBU2261139.1 tripartite tricarboxylate transporter TctB family protein [Pseudomonadota bacterium]